jgi:hypothetical protein
MRVKLSLKAVCDKLVVGLKPHTVCLNTRLTRVNIFLLAANRSMNSLFLNAADGLMREYFNQL